MCGIFGWQWKQGQMPPKVQRDRLATVLGVLNDNRGGHSWGGWTPASGVRKGLGDIAPHAGDFRHATMGLFHTRFATTGGRTVENAHPFEVGGIIGAHNGVIYNHREMEKKYDRKFEVDSQHLFAHLDAGLPFKELEGYGVIEFVRRDRPGRIFLAKLTPHADLEVVETEYGIVWSSKEEHLKTALAAAGLGRGESFKVPHGTQHYIEEGKFWQDKALPDLAIERSSFTDHRTSGGRQYGNVTSYGPYGGYTGASFYADKEETTPAYGAVIGFRGGASAIPSKGGGSDEATKSDGPGTGGPDSVPDVGAGAVRQDSWPAHDLRSAGPLSAWEKAETVFISEGGVSSIAPTDEPVDDSDGVFDRACEVYEAHGGRLPPNLIILSDGELDAVLDYGEEYAGFSAQGMQDYERAYEEWALRTTYRYQFHHVLAKKHRLTPTELRALCGEDAQETAQQQQQQQQKTGTDV